MKKLFALLTAILLLIPLCSCTYSQSAQDGGLEIMYGCYLPFSSKLRNPDGACVHGFTWDGDSGNTSIVIPDKFGSQKIKKLGGYWGRGLPCPFYIDDTSWMGIEDDAAYSVSYEMFEDHSDEWSEIVYHDFDLYIGRYVDGIYGHPCAVVLTVDGVQTAYCPRVTVRCDENNRTFYSKDGRLYFRDTDELVGEFVYSEEN